MSNTAWRARHGLGAAQYQSEFDQFVQQGFRLRNISGYTVQGQDLYAALWEQASGPPWLALHGLTAAEYQTRFNDLRQQGYRPIHVCGYGDGGAPRFAGLWEKSTGTDWQARHGLTAAQYEQEFDKWLAEGYRLIDVSGYEAHGEAQYAAIWIRTGGPAWQARHGISPTEYQAEFDALQQQGYRLRHVRGYKVGAQDQYAAIWDKAPSSGWQARHGLSSSDYQNAFDGYAYQGYRLTCVAGYSDGAQARYAAIWESEGIRVNELNDMDKVVQDFMTKFDVPGMSIAIAKDDRLVYARGFGLADQADHEPVTIHSRFRIASISKPITAVTVFELIEQGKLHLSDKVFGTHGILGTTYGTQPYKQYVEDITIEHLLTHTAGGWQNDANDPMFLNPAMNHAQLISWALDNQMLANPPGANYAYSNFGYCVLGRVIEKVTNQSYDNAVRQRTLQPCGVTNMTIAGNTLTQRQANEVVYYGQNGEDPYNMQVTRMDSHGGWVASAIDLIRFAVHVDGFPGKLDILNSASIQTMTTASTANSGYARGWAVNAARNWWHGGSLPGTSTIMVRTSGRFCWAALTNTRRPDSGIGGELDQMMWNVIGKVTSWPAFDLF